MSVELKIKSMTLANEAVIIRRQEQKLKRSRDWLKANQTHAEAEAIDVKRNSLSDHRRGVVRNENRATYLARAFIAGKPYQLLEQKADPAFVNYYIVPKVVAMVKKYHDSGVGTPEVNDWIYGE